MKMASGCWEVLQREQSLNFSFDMILMENGKGRQVRESGGPECHKLVIDTREHQGLPREWGKVVR